MISAQDEPTRLRIQSIVQERRGPNANAPATPAILGRRSNDGSGHSASAEIDPEASSARAGRPTRALVRSN